MTKTNTTVSAPAWLDAFTEKVATARLNEGIHTIKITGIVPDMKATIPTVIISFTAEDGIVRSEKLHNVTKDGKEYTFLDEFITNLATQIGSQPIGSLLSNAPGTELTAELQHNGSFDRWRFFKKQPAVAYTAVDAPATTVKPRKRG